MINVSYRHNKTFGILKVMIGANIPSDIDPKIREKLIEEIPKKHELDSVKEVDIDIVDVSYVTDHNQRIIALVHYAIL